MLWNIKVFGIVQGVGFRPFVSRLAEAFSICGSVANRGSYVEIFAQGEDISDFVKAITEQAPLRSTILKIDVAEIADEKIFTGFEIIDSAREVGDIFVSPDIAICDVCANELFDKNNRRYLHPFINCTACGPRLTILKNMPYDRERTSMGDFPMCESCAAEYFNPDSRRFDAQPICCNECGPEIYLVNGARGNAAIIQARKILAEGGVVAIKGIGGFHLACDAKNFSAVQKLRESKFRPSKPFAVMFKDIAAVRRECILTDAQLKFLDSPQKPIVLLKKNPAGTIAENVAPKINKLGAMLPYTPVHLLLFTYPLSLVPNFPDALVMTSGNPSGVPIAIDDVDAQELCSVVLSNNRKILMRADDSVMDFVNDAPSMIRRSRGYAPLPIFYERKKNKPVLAIGGELKNTFALAKNNLIYASPYIGDVSDLRTLGILKSSIRRMADLLEIEPEVVACDKHPRYQTAKLAAEFNLPVVKIQHHYAHILSCLAENNFHGEVIGVAFDGTGYGDDGTIWGGEIFICDAENYRRVGHISKFLQAGGDNSARDGWKIALSMMDLDCAKKLNLADEKNLAAQAFLLTNKINCVESTSCGRLFDAVSAILGICKSSSYEGEAAMKLQAVAEQSQTLAPIPLPLAPDTLPTDKLFAEILSRRIEGVNSGVLARFFHEQLAEMVAQFCENLSFRTKINTVALGGGVFQNSLLTSLTIEKLNQRGLKVLRHKFIPANDGGLCIGQALKAQSCL